MKYAGDFNEIQFMALFYQNTMEIFWKNNLGIIPKYAWEFLPEYTRECYCTWIFVVNIPEYIVEFYQNIWWSFTRIYGGVLPEDMVEFYQNIRGILANIRRTKRWNITIKENNVALDYLSIFSVRQPTPAASRAVNTSIRSSNLPYMAFLYMTRTSIILYNLCGKFIRKKQKLY